jgi:hypothetical protein
MKKLIFVFLLLIFGGWLFIQTLGCDSPVLALHIIEQVKPGIPVFDFRNKWMLTRNGFERINNYHLVDITIRELDDSGNEIAKVWSIKNNGTSYDLRQIVYGQVPPGWQQVASPKPLKLKTMYSLNFIKIFRITEDWHYVSLPDRAFADTKNHIL